MAKDYARKPQRKGESRPARKSPAKTQQGGLSLKWILSLATVGGFIGFIVYLNSLPAPERTQAPVQEKQTSSETGSQAKAPDEKKPGFKFYDMLPDSEVVPPKVNEYTPGPAQTTFDYLVQTGSFRTQADAERQRAQIAFQGLRAYVSRIDLDGGSTWYRVNVGPFNSRSQMNSAVDRLVSINIEPLVRKIPKDTTKSD